MIKLNRKQNDGFTLVELLIVVAIIGIIAAIAIPNLLSAIQRGKQKRTMGDLKTVGSGLEQYNTDSNTYPPQAALGTVNTIMTTAYLTDGYLTTPIFKDGWWSSATPTSNLIQYVTSASNQSYVLCSFGKDAAANGTNDCSAGSIDVTAAVDSTTFDCDVVLANGQFIQAPNGKQRSGTGGC